MRSANYRFSHWIAGWIYAAATLMLLAAALLWLLDSDYFPIRQLQYLVINNDGQQVQLQRIDQNELDFAAIESIHGNFLKVNLNQMKARFEKVPWVKEVEVKRLWPDTLQIILTEHIPVARWNQQALLDAQGEVFDAVTEEVFPEIIGPTKNEQKLGQLYADMAAILMKENLLMQQLVCSERLACTVVLANGFAIKLGSEDKVARLQRFVTLWPTVIAPHQNEWKYVDMRYSSGFAAPNHQKPSF